VAFRSVAFRSVAFRSVAFRSVASGMDSPERHGGRSLQRRPKENHAAAALSSRGRLFFSMEKHL
jgi:hypothetical protein